MSLVLVDDSGPIRTLTLNRPQKLNALSTALVDELSARLLEAGSDETVRVIILAGAGRSFCAGYDLDEESPTGPAATLTTSLDRLMEVYDTPKPVIASVQGHCVAGGLDLMMLCDLAVAAEDAVFGQPEIKFGAAVVAHALPWLIGMRRAKELLLTGDYVDAARAEQLGLVNRVVPRSDLKSAAMELGRRLSVIDPRVVRLSKRAIGMAWDEAGFREALRTGAEIGGEIEMDHSEERVEFERIVAEQGMKAALEWREARFGK